GVPDEHALSTLARGPVLEDGPTQPAGVSLVRRGTSDATIEITVTEGKKRQVRRMCKNVGHPVLTLTRVRYDGIPLGRLGSGRWRRLTPAEIRSLKHSVGLAGEDRARPRAPRREAAQ